MKASFSFTKLFFFSSLLIFLVAFSVPDADARAGRGRSFRAPRMQRSYNPSNSYNANNQYNRGASEQRRSLFGQNQSSGFLKSMAGGLAGGLIGSMLFSSLSGHAGTSAVPGVGGTGAGGGIGFFEILLFAGLGFLLFKFFKSRREMSASRAMGPNMEVAHGPTYGYNEESPNSEGRYYQSSSWRDNESLNKEKWLDIFFNVQAAWSRGELSAIAKDLTWEVQKFLQEELDQLKNQGLKNTIDSIAVRQSDVVEEWQEQNQEFVVVKFNANLVDYTVDLKTGQTVEGSKTQSIRFEELWTFAKEGMEWKLAGIDQVNQH